MQRTTKVFFVGFGFVLVLAAVFFAVDYGINMGSQNIQTINAPLVSGTPNLNSPGTENFWSSVPSYTAYLEPALAFPGSTAGETSFVTVKMAWINSASPELVALLTFSNYGSGPSYANSPPLINYSGTITPLIPNPGCGFNLTGNSTCYGGFYPQDVGNFQIYHNSSVVYPEQASIWWGLAPGANTTTFFQVSYKPKMVLGTSGQLGTGSGGAAEIWTWSSNPTDNSTADKGYPGMFFANGTAALPQRFGMPVNASYAVDGYTNGTTYYQIGGLPPRTLLPYANTALVPTSPSSPSVPANALYNPFEVQARGAYSSSSNSWNVEFVRPLTTPPNSGQNLLQEQLNQKSGQTYFVAFSVTQGNGGETYLQYYNSISFWWQFRLLSGSAPGFTAFPLRFEPNLLASFLAPGFALVAFHARKTQK